MTKILPSSSGLKMALPVTRLMSTPSPKAASVSSTPHATEPVRKSFSSSVMVGLLFFSLRAVSACVVRPAAAITSTVTGRMAIRMGSSSCPISAHSSMMPAAAGTNSSGKTTGQVGAGFLDLLQLYNTGGQSCQQQHQAVHTGRHRQRQHRVQHLAQKTERKNAPELKNILRVRTPLSGLMVL